jgi:hypothetical protein
MKPIAGQNIVLQCMTVFEEWKVSPGSNNLKCAGDLHGSGFHGFCGGKGCIEVG